MGINIFFKGIDKISIDDFLKYIGLIVVLLTIPQLLKLLKSATFEYKDIVLKLDSIGQTMDTISDMPKMISAIHEYLYNSNNAIVPALMDDLRTARMDILHTVFNDLCEYRANLVYQLMAESKNHEKIKIRKKMLRIVEPLKIVYSRYNQIGEVSRLHKCEAQLTYALKDSYYDDENAKINGFKEAYKYISEAIEHQEQSAGRYQCKIVNYEFNRLILAININEDYYKKYISDDYNVVLRDDGARYMLYETKPIIAPGLIEWENANGRKQEREEWIKSHNLTIAST
jgi:hypothetical protein